eukprot:TRINITY_DN24511_c0_g1_i1.p2 TRINITY_DN24511_c0_g1~~TRINITY_DN24511_c0_g1_i1.p2  ORF type:complete len:271 (-),score=24.87 TRINITY_DN24511_c0_g1_i1:54-827(-)
MPDLTLLWRLMSQPHNRMRVEYLPPVVPTPAEQKDPRAFAERVRLLMARRLNLCLTDHSFGDVLLALEAKKLRLPTGTACVEFGVFEKLFRLDAREAKEYLRKFKKMDVDRSGTIGYEGFIAALGLPDSAAARTVFDMLDQADRGRINFREFLAGLVFVSRHPRFRESVEATFKRLDADADGQLSVDEARQGMKLIFPPISEEQLSLLCELLGLGSKSHLSWDDFQHFLHLHPEYLVAILAADLTEDGEEEEKVTQE